MQCFCVFASGGFICGVCVFIISGFDRKTVASQMAVFANTLSPHHEGVIKITTILSVINGNLGAIARMSNDT